MKKFKIFAFISDIHIGKKKQDSKRLKHMLIEYHLKPLKTMTHLDGIFVLGDVMDTIVSMNSDSSELFHWLVSKWYNIAKQRKCPCIIIRGTRSHDNDQLNNIKHYQNNEDGVDFRVYDTIEEITLYDNKYDILLLPDIKIKDPKDMEKFLNKRYDMILGHGLISTMQFFVQESENMPTKTYVYDIQRLMDICRGPIIFGHIHHHTNYKDKFYYIGSFDKLERGSTGKNGFLICGIHDNTKEFIVEQYINEEASDYLLIDLDEEYLINTSIDAIIKDINNVIIDMKEKDLITLTIDRVDDALEKISVIVEYFQQDHRISIKKKSRNRKIDESDKKMKDKRDKYSYLMDDIEVSEIMHRYYIDNREIYMSTVELQLDHIKKILGEK